MRCIWQMDGDKVKGFKCDFSPVDMLMIISGLKYIVADIERHPKDRERAQGIYNQIMLCRYYDEADHKTENSSEKPNNCEPKICDTCRYYNSNIPCGSTPSACKEADKFAEEFVEGLKKLKPTGSKMEQVETMSCQECKHFHENAVMYLDQCDFCFKDCKYEPKNESQMERSSE